MSDALPGVELGTYYVSVTTSTRRLVRDLSRGADAAGDSAGRTAGDAYAESFSRRASKGIQTGLKVGLAAIAGTVAFKGIDRILAIDNAEAKLRGLGSTTTGVASIMDSALKSVQGTAFGLGDAATIAASAVAAGVNQGADLTKYLTLTADAASIAQTSLSDMGGVLNNVRTVGVAYNDTLQTLAGKGIPIYSLLAKRIGVTAGEVKQLASEGKITADVFEEALGRQVTGAALKAGETIEGSFDNVLASLGRIGESVLTGTTDDLPAVFEELTNSLKPVEQSAKTVGDVLGFVAGVAKSLPAPLIASGAALLVMSNIAPKLADRFEGGGTALANLARTAGTARVFIAGTGGELVATSGKMAAFTTAARGAKSALLGAFGGPVGLAATAGIVVITSALTAWTSATQAQQANVDLLTDSLDQNSGAITEATRKTIFDALGNGDDAVVKGAIDSVEALGLSSSEFLDNILTAGPAQDAYRAKLESIATAAQQVVDANTGEIADPAAYANAIYALKAYDSQITAVGSSTKAFDQATRAGATATEDIGNTAGDTSEEFKTLADAVEMAFAAVDNAASQTQAIDDLAASIVENGKTLDAETSKGAENAQELQSTISALATAAGDDTALFASNVMGLMAALDKQGVDTTGVMSAVRQSLVNVAGEKWAVLLDGSQSIKEAKQIAKANLAAAESALALIIASAPTDNLNGRTNAAQERVNRAREALDDLRDATRAADSIATTYAGATSTAQRAADEAGKKTSKSAKKAKTDIKDALADIESALDAINPKASKRSSEAQAVRDGILDLYNAKGINKAKRNALLKAVDAADKKMQSIAGKREKLAVQIDKASAAVDDAISQRDGFKQSVIDGYKALGDIAKLAADTSTTITTYEQIGDTLFAVTKNSSGSVEGVLSSLRSQVDEAGKFNKAFKALTAAGLNDTSLQDIVNGFLQSGDSSLAASVLGGGKSAIDEINDLEKELGGLGAGLGKFGADSMFQGGVDTAKGFLKGLQSQDKEMIAAYEHIADSLVKTVKKKLGIHSPSRVMARLAEYTSDGWNDNLKFKDAAPSAVAPAGTLRSIGSSSPGGGPAVINIYDVDGVLMGTMRGEAQEVVDSSMMRLAVQL